MMISQAPCACSFVSRESASGQIQFSSTTPYKKELKLMANAALLKKGEGVTVPGFVLSTLARALFGDGDRDCMAVPPRPGALRSCSPGTAGTQRDPL